MTTRKYPKEVITMVETFKKLKNEEKSLSLEFKIPNEYYDHDRNSFRVVNIALQTVLYYQCNQECY